MTEHTSAEQLLQRVAAGDREAWGELYRRYRPDVHRYASRRVPGRPDDVEDLVQETFVRVVEMAAEFESGTTTVGVWLCKRVAWCVISDFFRRDRHTHLMAIGVAVDAIRRGPIESTETRESRPVSVEVVTALARLTPGQRRAMQLRYLDGLDCEAAGEIAGLTANTIASHCVTARRRLRADLAHRAPAGQTWLDLVPKKTALAEAFRAVGPDAHAALAWLRGQGIAVNTAYAYAEARAARAGAVAIDTHLSTPLPALDQHAADLDQDRRVAEDSEVAA